MRKTPVSEVVWVLSSPVRSFVTTTVAPPTNAPLLSRTVPENFPWSVCADAAADIAATNTMTSPHLHISIDSRLLDGLCEISRRRLQSCGYDATDTGCVN